MVFTHSDSPVVVVLSGSMEPAYSRGDILFLWLGTDPISVGEVCVFRLPGRDIPSVHRVLEVHDRADGSQEYLTKGDANGVDDRGLYNDGRSPTTMFLRREHIVGRARAYVLFRSASNCQASYLTALLFIYLLLNVMPTDSCPTLVW